MHEALNKTKTLMDKIKHQRIYLAKNVLKYEDAIRETATKLDIAKLAVVMSQKVYDERVASFFKNLEDIVSYGLTKVFSKEYKFMVEYRTSGCKFWLASEDTGMEPVDLISGHGGGVIQVTSFILHAYALGFSSADKILILDEPFAQISKEYKPVLALLVKELTDKLNFQFVLVSHDEEMMEYLSEHPNTICYRAFIKNGATEIKRLGA